MMDFPDVSKKAAGTGGLIVASTPSAARAGRDVLLRGGNAADAALSAALAVCVTDPVNLSIAGRCHAVVAEPDGLIEVIDGATQAPKQLPSLGPIPIPGLPAGLAMLHNRHGRLAQGGLFEAAIRLAREGFPVSPEVARVWQRHEPELALNPTSRVFHLNGGRAPLSQTCFVQPSLAGFLEDLQRNGLDHFYEHAGVVQEGPWPVRELRAYSARSGQSSRLDLDGCQLVTTGKQAWGPVLTHLLDRLMHMPSEHDMLLKLDRVAQICARALPTKLSAHLNADLDTTHLICVDADGMMISLTGSIGPHFGAKKAHPSLGFLYPWSYDMMTGSAPGRRDVTEMCPSILLKNGKPWIAIGATGSERIPQAIAQCLRYRLQDELDLVASVSAPRLTAVHDRVRLWNGTDNNLLSRLARLGWRVERAGPGHVDHVGVVHAAEILDGGRVTGVADMAYDGTVLSVS